MTRCQSYSLGASAADLIITVCDRAHEELDPPADWLHWSIPDPVDVGSKRAFDAALSELDDRITTIATHRPDKVGDGAT